MTEPRSVADVDEGDYILIDDHPCMIMELDDEDGATYKIKGQDVLDGKPYEKTFESGASVQMVDVQQEECEVESVNVQSNTVYLLDGTAVAGRYEHTASELYELISGKEMQGQTDKPFITIVTALGRKAAM